MAELPPPDLMDSAGRARRIVLGLLIGAATGGLAYFLANMLIAPEPSAMHVSTRQMDRDTFVIYVGLIASVVSFVVALTIQNRIAKAAWERERVPQAKVR